MRLCLALTTGPVATVMVSAHVPAPLDIPDVFVKPVITINISAIKQTNSEDGFNYISNAGGAFLEWLEGNESPGVIALKGNNIT